MEGEWGWEGGDTIKGGKVVHARVGGRNSHAPQLTRAWPLDCELAIHAQLIGKKQLDSKSSLCLVVSVNSWFCPKLHTKRGKKAQIDS